jgi:protein gp37
MEKRFHLDGPVTIRPERLDAPLRRKKPTVWAIWNDLFHEDVPVNFLEDTLATITLCPQHTFLILTKRAQRLNLMTRDRLRVSRTDTWPIKNLWLGVTVCNQEEADEKIPILLKIPAAHRWVSIEPMLGQIDLDQTCPGKPVENGWCWREGLDCVVLGGESGPKARPLHPDWARSVRDQCQAAKVPFFFKQWGEWCAPSQLSAGSAIRYSDYGSFDPDSTIPKKFSSKIAGRLLDGREWNELPWLTSNK